MFIKRNIKVTIKDIAKKCDVSTQTVSRVINNRPDVSPLTREKVQTVIKEMGYYPSAVARSLVKQNSLTIGVVMGGLRYLGVSNTLDGITEACEEAKYSLLINQVFQIDSPNIVHFIETLMQQQVEGIIFAVPDVNDNIRITKQRLPADCPPIVFLKCEPDLNFTTLNIDNYGGAKKAVDYLVSIGRHHVGLLAGPLSWLEARQRKKGWEDALKQYGIEISSRNWAEGDWSSSSGEKAFSELHEKFPEMDAVFASNDQMALGAMYYSNLHGIRIPQDIAFVGFDDWPEGAYFSPALSTVTHPLRALGSQAVKVLLEMIHTKSDMKTGRVITLETGLIIRESS